MPANESYATFPSHPLHDVPQDVIDATRKRLKEIVEYEHNMQVTSGSKMFSGILEDLDSIYAVADSILMAAWITLKEQKDPDE